MKPLQIFIGWDPRESLAYHVLAHSIVSRASGPVSLVPLVQRQLRERDIYTRGIDPLAATEFSLTRFLAPYLCNFEGVSIFMDCDMLCRADIYEAVEHLEQQQCAIAVCQHDYVPKAAIKMDGQAQTTYPRKNWSSFMVFDNAQCRALSRPYVNGASPSDLHRFAWCQSEIGTLPLDWNWLVDEYAHNDAAKNLHYTNGGPWFPATRSCDHADDWHRAVAEMSGVRG